MEDDHLYYLGINRSQAAPFSDIKYVAMGGSNDRMEQFAFKIAERIGIPKEEV
jgi:hypothetical protein